MNKINITVEYQIYLTTLIKINVNVLNFTLQISHRQKVITEYITKLVKVRIKFITKYILCIKQTKYVHTYRTKCNKRKCIHVKVSETPYICPEDSASSESTICREISSTIRVSQRYTWLEGCSLILQFHPNAP